MNSCYFVAVNKTITSHYIRWFCQISYNNSGYLELLDREVEADDSYFGSNRGKRKWGRDAADKVPVFALLKRNSKVPTVIPPDAKANTLIPIIRQQA